MIGRATGPRATVVAIGIDAAEPALVRALLDAGRLPRLARLRDRGAWARVHGPARIGSGAVWPTFLTGVPPQRHGVYGEWQWEPGGMCVARARWSHLRPFWAPLAAAGRRVTVLDVPFAPPVRMPGCAEVLEWGAHDALTGRLEVWPDALAPLVRAAAAPHPFAGERVDAAGPHDTAGLRRVVERCRAGVRQRGELARALLRETRPDVFLIAFTEVHRASHLLWHTVEANGTVGAAAGDAGAGLPDLLAEVDAEIGRLVEAAGPEATVVVFSLHGMRPTRGIPTVLAPLLLGLGHARTRGWRELTQAERVGAAVRAAKRWTPGVVKRAYYRLLSPATTARLAQPSMPMPPYDWTRTDAFSIPTDQHGWVRVNLAGREAQGRVAPERYEALCRDLTRALGAQRTADGRQLVREVVPVRDGGGAPPAELPDLVVHWTDAAMAVPVRLARPRVRAMPIGLKFTGQHALEGFALVHPGRGAAALPEAIGVEDLHRLVAGTTSAGGGPPGA